jgi:hypothetical protein
MTGGLFARLWALRGAALTGIERFPVALLWLAGFVVVVNLDIAGALDLDGEVIARAGAASGAAAAIATAWVLSCERRALSPPIRHGASFALAALFGAAIWFWDPLAVAPPALVTAAVLAVPLAPYLRREAGGFWGFFWALVHAGALAFLAVIIFCIGLSAILASLQYLFDIDIDWSIYGHVWSIGLGFVGPLFALALVPRLFPDRDLVDANDVFITAVRILADFVAIPLIAAYAVILHAYALKILLTGEVPRNQIGWMVLSFGLAVMSLRILVHPLRTVGRVPTRLFLRFWALPLVVPLMLLAGAVGQRISDYGVTPERYGVALFAIFLATVLLAQLHPRWRGDIRVIPGLGAVWLLIASFGPWGVLSVSAASQTSRLVDHLAAANALQGTSLAGTPELPPTAARDVHSIVFMLHEIGQLERLRPLFAAAAGLPDDPFTPPADAGKRPDWLPRQVLAALDAEDVPAIADPDGRFWTEPGRPAAVPLVGYDVMVPYVAWSGPATTVIEVPGLPLSIEMSELEIAFSDTAGRIVLPREEIRKAIAQRLDLAMAGGDPAGEPLFVEMVPQGRRIGVLLENLGGQVTGDELRLGSGRMILFLRRADWSG